jgi:hypothetical protein
VGVTLFGIYHKKLETEKVYNINKKIKIAPGEAKVARGSMI